jgi:hypothetical protein
MQFALETVKVLVITQLFTTKDTKATKNIIKWIKLLKLRALRVLRGKLLQSWI